MDGTPSGYISTSTVDEEILFGYFMHSAFVRVNEHMSRVLRDMGVGGKVQVGCIVHLVDGVYLVKSKVIVQTKGHFFHEEPWEMFPSECFKTKILMVCG